MFREVRFSRRSNFFELLFKQSYICLVEYRKGKVGLKRRRAFVVYRKKIGRDIMKKRTISI